MTKREPSPIIGITMGDPSGIGPEVTVEALSHPRLPDQARYLVIGERERIRQALKRLHLSTRLHVMPVKARRPLALKPHGINLLNLGNLDRPAPIGKISPRCGKAAKEYIDTALTLIEEGEIQGLVTGPINKAAIIQAGFAWIGHTEYLIRRTKSHRACMLFVGGPLRVALVTRDLPLRDVARLITAKRIEETAELLYRALQRWFGIAYPRIGIASFNPHAGDQGALGREELDQIGPAIQALQTRGWAVEGPVPSDAIFVRAAQGRYDGVVAMYHDQALIPLKLLAKTEAINVTLGLPFVRTSPAHGTAHDIVGKQRPDPQPMFEAIKLAVQMVRRHLP